MKLNIEFLQTGGVPLTNDLMDQIMQAITLYDVLGSVVGHMTILSGCDAVAGSTTQLNPGVVSINDEVLYFEGGLISTNVFIYEENQTEVFEDQSLKVLVKKRSVRFGNGVAPNSFVWADFVKLQTLKNIQLTKANQSDLEALEDRVEILEQKTAPIINGGVVFIWQKPVADIPQGWKECTDLQGKTVFGLDSANPNFNQLWNEGGSTTKSIAKTNLPALSATFGIIHPYSGSNASGGFDGGSNIWKNQNITINVGGSSTPMDVMNPYRVAVFIEPDFQ